MQRADVSVGAAAEVIALLGAACVRLERVYSVQLKVYGADICKVTDWDLKQSIRNFCQSSDPLCERIERTSGGRTVTLSYGDKGARHMVSEAVYLLRGKVKINSYLLSIEVAAVDAEGSKEHTLKSVPQSVWLKNLPTRWFELDSFQEECVIPQDHVLRSFLEERFGPVSHMESRGGEQQLLCDVCVRFTSASSCLGLKSTLGNDSCVARKEGASAVFLIGAELDSAGFLSPQSCKERAVSRARVGSGRAELRGGEAALTSLLEGAEALAGNQNILDILDSALVLSAHSSLREECSRGRFLLKETKIADSKNVPEDISMHKRCAALQSTCTLVASLMHALRLSVEKECALRQAAQRAAAEECLQRDLRGEQGRAGGDVGAAEQLCAMGEECCALHGWTDASQRLIPRARVLASTLSQLLRKGAGGGRYLAVLQRARAALSQYMQRISPAVQLLATFSVLIVFLDKTETEINATVGDSGNDNANNNSNDNNGDSNSKGKGVYVGDIAVSMVRDLITIGRERLRAFLDSIRDCSVDSDTGTGILADSDEVTSGGGEAPVDGIKGPGSLPSLLQDSGGVSEEDLLSIQQAVEVLLNVEGQLKGTEMLADTFRKYEHGHRGQRDVESKEERNGERSTDSNSSAACAVCSTLPCCCSNADLTLRQLHVTLLSDIIHPFDYRISRISVLLGVAAESLLEPQQQRGLRNSADTCCSLLREGVEGYEGDREELEREQRRIIEAERREEAEGRRRVKEGKRRLLEEKIATLKQRKRELEEEEQRKIERELADTRTEETRVEGLQRKEGDREGQGVPSKGEGREGDRQPHSQYSDSSYDRNNGCSNDDYNNNNHDHYNNNNSNRNKRDREREDNDGRWGAGEEDRYDERRGEGELERRECVRGEHVFDLQRPCWDVSTAHARTAGSNSHDEGHYSSSSSNRNSYSCRNSSGDIAGGNRLLSAVGCTVAERTVVAEGMTSSSRRKRNQTQIPADGSTGATTSNPNTYDDYGNPHNNGHDSNGSSGSNGDGGRIEAEVPSLHDRTGTLESAVFLSSIPPLGTDRERGQQEGIEKGSQEGLMRERLLAARLKKQLVGKRKK